jgi:hypothetical protein
VSLPPTSARGPRSTAAQVIERAHATAERQGECLLVTAWKPGPGGYIRVAAVDERGGMVMLHRLVAESTLGRRLDRTEVVDHVCHNAAVKRGECKGGDTCAHRRCANPAHLEVTDHVGNWVQGMQGAPRERRAKSHCPAGHPYEPANLVAGNGSARSCKACHRARKSGRDPRSEPTYI